MDNITKITKRVELLQEAIAHIKKTGRLPLWLQVDLDKYERQNGQKLNAVIVEQENSCGRKKAVRIAAERHFSGHERSNSVCSSLIPASGDISEVP